MSTYLRKYKILSKIPQLHYANYPSLQGFSRMRSLVEEFQSRERCWSGKFDIVPFPRKRRLWAFSKYASGLGSTSIYTQRNYKNEWSGVTFFRSIYGAYCGLRFRTYCKRSEEERFVTIELCTIIDWGSICRTPQDGGLKNKAPFPLKITHWVARRIWTNTLDQILYTNMRKTTIRKCGDPL